MVYELFPRQLKWHAIVVGLVLSWDYYEGKFERYRSPNFSKLCKNSVIWETISENVGKYHFITHVLLKKWVLDEFRGLTYQSRGKRGLQQNNMGI